MDKPSRRDFTKRMLGSLLFGVKPEKSFTGRDYIDPANAETIKGGLIRARRIEVKEAYKLYGKS
jgi:hypothetical protein